MVITYLILGISALMGSAIAWEEVKNTSEADKTA